MALKIVTGGTTGAADGTLVSSGNPLVIAALNTAIDAHIRCDDGYWSADQSFDVPAELEVSFDGGSTWYGNADEPITAPEIEDVNYPIKIRQVAASGSTSGSFTTDGTYTAISALSTPTLTATVVSGSQIDLSWTNVSNENGYTIERSLDGSSWSALTTKSANVTTHSDTGLSAGTHYYYRVKATGIGRYSDSGWGTDDDTTSLAAVAGFAASVSGTTVNLSWTAFAGADHYKIERGTDGVTYGTTVSDAATGTSYADTGRSANTVYYYRITAHNSGHTAISAVATCGAGVQILFTASSTRNIRGFHATTFATARSGSGTNSVVGSDATVEGAVTQEGGGFYLDRTYAHFDTSSVPAGIDEAYLRQTSTTNYSGSTGWTIEKGTYSNNPPVAADFASIGGTDLGGPSSSPTVNTPTDRAISSPATNVISGGITKLVSRDRTHDYGNSAPGTGVIHGSNIGGKGNATSDYRPQLKVSYHF